MAAILNEGLSDQALIRATLVKWISGVPIPNLAEPDLILGAANYFANGSFSVPQRGRTKARLWFALHRALIPSSPPFERVVAEQCALYELVAAAFTRIANASLPAPSRSHGKNTLLQILSSYPKP